MILTPQSRWDRARRNWLSLFNFFIAICGPVRYIIFRLLLLNSIFRCLLGRQWSNWVGTQVDICIDFLSWIFNLLSISHCGIFRRAQSFLFWAVSVCLGCCRLVVGRFVTLVQPRSEQRNKKNSPSPFSDGFSESSLFSVVQSIWPMKLLLNYSTFFPVSNLVLVSSERGTK